MLTCRRCDQSFPDRYQFKLHLKTHEGEKCFKCDLCTYASISSRHLESHMLIHTDQKPVKKYCLVGIYFRLIIFRLFSHFSMSVSIVIYHSGKNSCLKGTKIFITILIMFLQYQKRKHMNAASVAKRSDTRVT